MALGWGRLGFDQSPDIQADKYRWGWDRAGSIQEGTGAAAPPGWAGMLWGFSPASSSPTSASAFLLTQPVVPWNRGGFNQWQARGWGCSSSTMHVAPEVHLIPTRPKTHERQPCVVATFSWGCLTRRRNALQFIHSVTSCFLGIPPSCHWFMSWGSLKYLPVLSPSITR